LSDTVQLYWQLEIDFKMVEVENGIDIRSEEVQEILGTPPSWLVRWGTTMAFAIVVIFGWIGYLVEYPDIVAADIKVTSIDPPKRILAPNSLNISKVWVNNEDTVKTGQILVTFNAKGNYGDIILLDKYLTDLKTINDSTLLIFNPPRRLILGDIQDELYDFIEKQETFRRYTQGKQFDNLSVIQLNRELGNLRRGILIDLRSIKKLEEELAIVNRRYDEQDRGVREKVVAIRTLDQTKEKMLSLDRERQGIEANIKNKEFQIQTIQNKINGVEKDNVENKQIAYERLEESFDNLRNQLESWKKNYTITSPIDGIVIIASESIGDNQYVSNNQSLMDVFPFSQGDVIGKINLNLSGSGKVSPGQDVIVKFASYPFQEFGAVKGVVSWKGTIPSNGAVPLKVTFPKGLVTTTGRRIKPNQEMEGIAEIITADKRFIERIFERLRRSVT